MVSRRILQQESPKISVIIPTYGRPDLLEKTLQSLAECELPSAFDELIVVENGSKMGAGKLVSTLPDRLNARYMYVEMANKSNALNVALETVDDRLVFFTDDDARFHSKTLSAYIEVASMHGKGYFFGGPVKVIREEEPPEWMEPLLPFGARGYDLINTRMRNIYLGINWAAFSTDIKKLGGFDIRFGPGSATGATGQETNMEERMLEAGMKGIDVMDAIVWHYVPKERCNINWLKRRFFLYGKSLARKKSGKKSQSIEFFNMVKYIIRWFVYLVLFNKEERMRSQMKFITRLGYFKGIFLKNS